MQPSGRSSCVASAHRLALPPQRLTLQLQPAPQAASLAHCHVAKLPLLQRL